jgi:hypothetical protein
MKVVIIREKGEDSNASIQKTVQFLRKNLGLGKIYLTFEGDAPRTLRYGPGVEGGIEESPINPFPPLLTKDPVAM